jgi:hypothetical protein
MTNNTSKLEEKSVDVKDSETDVCLPYRYSRYGVYSSHLFLVDAFVNYAYGFKTLTGFGLSLYITSVLHWRKIKHSGICKWLDILTCVSTVNYTTFVDSHYFITEHRNWWLVAKCLAISAYSINKYIEYYQQISEENCFDESEKYRYFCLKYTKPGTEHRESAYFYSTLVHIFGLHVPLVFTCINGVMHSHLKYNSFL